MDKTNEISKTNKNNSRSKKEIITKRIIIFLFVIEIIVCGIVFGYKYKMIQINKRLQDINISQTNELESLKSSIQTFNKDIADIQSEIDNLSNSNSDLETQITSLESELDYYNEQISLLGGDVYE